MSDTRAGAEYSKTKERRFYNEDGDCIEFIFNNDSYYGHRIDGLLTVYHSHETNEIVGALIKGVTGFVRHFQQTSPGFMIEIEDGSVKLGILFTAGMWKHGDDVAGRKYRRLRQEAEKLDVAVDVPAFA